MSSTLKLVLILLLFNGIQNIILAYRLRSIASIKGKKANYYARMLSDQIFLYERLIQEGNKDSVGYKNLLYYSIATTILQMAFLIALIVILS